MEGKHPFLLVLMIALFGIAVAGAIWIFGERNIQMRRDAIISGVQYVAADAFQYRRRPATMGGGGGTYERYSIPMKLRRSDLATYEVGQASSPDTLYILATGAHQIGTITAGVDANGAVTILELTGELSY
jgi:hypothetical protein